MKNFFFRSPQRGSNWALTGFVLGLIWLLGAARLQAAATVTTLGGGDPHVSPKYLGYRDGTTLSSALFHTPAGLAIDSTGSYLFVADRDNNAIRYLDLAAGLTWTFGVVNTNLVNKPVGVVVDTSLNVTVLNRGSGNNGSVVTFDSFGDTVATNATGLTNACGITMDVAGNLYVTVRSNTVIMITPAGVKTNVVTIPMAGTSLQGIVAKHNGLLAACDAGRNGIYLINPLTGLVTTNAGFHGRGDFPTNGNNVASSSTAKFFQPTGITEAGDGTLIVTDYGNNRVKVVLASGVVTNLYGVVSNFWGGTYKGWYDGAVVVPDYLAPNVQSRIPFGVAFAPDGSVYTSEDYYHLIRKATGAGFALPPPPPPTAPTIQSVVTNYGQVTLVWSTVANATSYNVKRSLSSGGPYITIANISATTYTDTQVINGTTYYYVVSALNAAVEGPNSVQVRVVPPVPPPPAPNIGWYDYEGNDLTGFFSVLHPVSGVNAYIAHNDLLLAIDPTITSGVATHYIAGSAPLSTNPGPTNSTPPFYQDHLSSIQPLSVTTVPDLVIKAVNIDGLGQSSAVAMAEFLFQVANPTIYGNNAAQFTISDITANARLYYTTDGSDPSITNGVDLGTVATSTNLWTVSLSITTNTLFKVRAFRSGYQPSAVLTTSFSPTNYVANIISFGFANGEASSDFIASPGQTFYAPVTLSVLPNTVMYSLQFNLSVTNGGPNPGPQLTPGAYNFNSFLQEPVPDTTPPIYEPIPPLMFYPYFVINPPPASSLVTFDGPNGVTNFVSMVTTNLSQNLLSVGWLERVGQKNLFDTTKQNLLTFSEVHDVLYDGGKGQVEVGGYSFQVPTNATTGQTYQIQIGRPSATSDGVGAPGSDVFIAAPTNGSMAAGLPISALKYVTVGQRKYIAGSVYPFRWFNAGDFGSSNIVSADVAQVFQAAIYNLDSPPAGSDFFDAMDSCGSYLASLDGTTGYYTNDTSTVGHANPLFDGNDTTINQLAYGDGVLDVCDVYVTFRRSLDPTLTWFRRFWNNGQRVADSGAVNIASHLVSKAGSVQAKIQFVTPSVAPQVNFAAGDLQGSAGQVVQIPITATIFGSYPLRVLMLNLTVTPLDGSPAITTQVQFTPNAALGTPALSASHGLGNVAATWLDATKSGLNGTVTLGTLTVTIPAGASAKSAYAIHFDHASASPNGLAAFAKQTLTGLITLSNRTNSTYLDGVPDSWRLRWFGTVNNLLSLSNACASGDGVNNFKKFVAGVDPNVANNFPSVNAVTPAPAGATSAIHWPTVSGKQYAIERSASLFPGAWSAIATNTGTGTDMEFDDNSIGKSQFYRVRILP